MTSNVGTKVIKDFGTGLGFSTKSRSLDRTDEMKSILEKELKKKFAPEFINRIEEIIYFNDLTQDNIRKILALELNKSISRLLELGYNAEVEESIIEKLMEVGYDPQYGARPMKRAIQRWIDDHLTDTLLENPELGSKFVISYDVDNDVTKITTKKPSKSKKTKKGGE
jgi:ATP-dependent Clp protease ATP-binding subunit ClpC